MKEEINSEYLILENHVLRNKIKNALDIVKNFIKENNLIIVGGMSIDLLLKKNNLEGIYGKYTVPDYDCISNKNVFYANNLAKILCEEGFPAISSIPALHPTTVRVKMSGITVFDSTFVSENIIKKIKTIKYKDFTIINQNYVKMDQLFSLSFLMESIGPTLNVIYRFTKDFKRHNLLENYFPIENKKISLEQKMNFDLSFIKTNIEYNKNNFISYSNYCIGGTLAYSLYYNEFLKLYNGFKDKYKDLDYNINDLVNTELNGFNELNNKISFNSFKNDKIMLISNQTEIPDIKKFKNIKYYNRWLDLKPNSIITDKYEIWDLFGKRLSCNNFKINNKDYTVCNFSYILLYCLFNYLQYDNENYLAFYYSLKKIINIVKELNEKDNELFEKITETKYMFSKFYYSISTFGKLDYNISYYAYILNFNYFVEYGRNIELLPKKSYPHLPNCNIKKEIDLSNSIFFQNNGEETDNTTTNLSMLLNL